ncbi:hypothetical protein L7F22_036360 [Adiantum nelumboides]|nr:hypothetical protein [Adiantum nelumboides]
MVPKPPAHSIHKLLAEGKRGASLGALEKLKLVQIEDEDSDSSITGTLSRFQEVGALLDKSAFAALLRWCISSKSLFDGQSVHVHITKVGLSQSGFLQTLLVQMYGNCGKLDRAFSVFTGMRKRDLFSCNFMIKVFVQEGHGFVAHELFHRMQQESILPDRILLINLLPACTDTADVNKLLIRLVRMGDEIDLFVGTTLIKLYGKHGQVECAREAFNSTAEKDTVLWTAMIAVYAQNKLTRNALFMFNEMAHSNIEPDDVTFLNVLSACATEGYLIDGMRVHAFIIDSGLDYNTHLRMLFSICIASAAL